jgi:hypothetical protein
MEPAARRPRSDSWINGADMTDVPGGASGMLCRDHRGKKTDRLVTRIDPGVVSLVAELRSHERQAAENWIKCRKPSTGCAPL